MRAREPLLVALGLLVALFALREPAGRLATRMTGTWVGRPR